MQSICNYIIENVAKNLDQTIHHSVMQCGSEMDMDMDDICTELYTFLDNTLITDFITYPEKIYMQRATSITFKYQGRICEIGQHFGTQTDYFWVRMLPV
jgi:hypothetical protein